MYRTKVSSGISEICRNVIYLLADGNYAIISDPFMLRKSYVWKAPHKIGLKVSDVGQNLRFIFFEVIMILLEISIRWRWQTFLCCHFYEGFAEVSSLWWILKLRQDTEKRLHLELEAKSSSVELSDIQGMTRATHIVSKKC